MLKRKIFDLVVAGILEVVEALLDLRFDGGTLGFYLWHRKGQGELPILLQDWSLPAWG